MCNKKITKYTCVQVEEHNASNDCWIIVNNYVYNITPFLFLHPPGYKQILKYAGTDCSYHLQFHSKKALKYLSFYLIGKIKK